jgi:hypothetical protein
MPYLAEGTEIMMHPRHSPAFPHNLAIPAIGFVLSNFGQDSHIEGLRWEDQADQPAQTKGCAEGASWPWLLARWRH